MARYDQDVMMWDMDVAGVQGVDSLVAAMKGSDLGYFEMVHQRTPLICHLAVPYFANSPAMRRAVATTPAYGGLKLRTTPYWLLD